MSRVLTWCAARLYLAYFATLRVRCVLDDGTRVRRTELPSLGGVYGVCERDALAASGLIAGQHMAVLVAHGRDGDWASALLAAIGCRVIRGSARRGGATGLRALIRHLRTTRTAVGLVVDGPLGPAGVAKPGAAMCALQGGRTLHAVGVACRWKLTFPRTWSGIYLPLPFSRIVFVDEPCGDPCRDANGLDAASEGLTRRLAIARDRATAVLLDRSGIARALAS
jgi:lysophospholipid acyltransferase (LPLAT)-like uncharacterized protein